MIGCLRLAFSCDVPGDRVSRFRFSSFRSTASICFVLSDHPFVFAERGNINKLSSADLLKDATAQTEPDKFSSADVLVRLSR